MISWKWLISLVVFVIGVGVIAHLILHQSDSIKPILCTGSMDPTITCFDTITFRNHPTPSDLQIGTVITFRLTDKCDLDSKHLIMHRVIDTKILNKIQYFRTQGDHNVTDDGCWIPFENVLYYVVKVEQIDNDQAKILLSRVWLAETVMLYQVREAAILQQEMQDLRECESCSVDALNQTIDQYNHLTTDYNHQIKKVVRLRLQLQEFRDGPFLGVK